MLKRTALTLLCSVLLIGFSFSQSLQKQNKDKPAVLFSVNKKPVSINEFIYLYKKNHQDPQKDFTAEKINEYLDLFINFKLKVEEARARGLDTTAAFLKEFSGYKDELRKPYLPDAKIIDSLVRLTYDRMKEEVNASHILVGLKPEASPADSLKAFNRIQALRKRILNGEDFGEVAAESSEDPSAKANKGNLGYFTAMQMVYPFESAAYSTAVGNVSQPVKTRFGYHILKVLDRRPARGEVEVSHIMLRTGNTKNNDEVKNTVFNIHDQLQGGVSWNELCAQYSEDPNTKENGGKLRPFGAGAMSAVPEFERIAFNLQMSGEISDPFQTQYGWHIMRLERKIPIPSFDEIAPTLKTKVARDERTELSKNDLQEKLRKDYTFIENLAAKSRFLALADSSLQKGKWNAKLPAKLGKEVLFTLKGNKFSVQSAVDYIRKNQKPNVQAPEKYFEQIYSQYVDASIIVFVEKDIKQKHPEYGFLLQEYYEGILLFDIMEKEVWSKASQDSAGQRSYYSAHLPEYVTEERAKATIYTSTGKELLKPLQQLISDSANTGIDDYLAENKIKTEVGFFRKDEKSILKQVPWVKGVYPTENNGIYYLAWLKDILPAGQMSFEEARPSVISDYQSFLERNWIAALKKKYVVKVNEKARQYILQQLQVTQ